MKKRIVSHLFTKAFADVGISRGTVATLFNASRGYPRGPECADFPWKSYFLNTSIIRHNYECQRTYLMKEKLEYCSVTLLFYNSNGQVKILKRSF